jgi:hypothetical protein
VTTVTLSISELSSELQQTRETIRKRFADAGVKPAGKRRNYAVFRLRDALRALLTAPGADPDRLDPFRRKAHFQAESAQLKLALDRGDLIRREDVEQAYAAVMKPIRLTLETLPDVLERDAGLSAQQVTRAERAIDELREHLHDDVLKGLKKRVRKSK